MGEGGRRKILAGHTPPFSARLIYEEPRGDEYKTCRLRSFLLSADTTNGRHGFATERNGETRPNPPASVPRKLPNLVAGPDGSPFLSEGNRECGGLRVCEAH